MFAFSGQVRRFSKRSVRVLIKPGAETKYGLPGDMVSVKPGYARNFLIPQKIAVYASKEKLKTYEEYVEQGRKRFLDSKRGASEMKKAKAAENKEREDKMLSAYRNYVNRLLDTKKTTRTFKEMYLQSESPLDWKIE